VHLYVVRRFEVASVVLPTVADYRKLFGAVAFHVMGSRYVHA
jgi:hypothetical protein